MPPTGAVPGTSPELTLATGLRRPTLGQLLRELAVVLALVVVLYAILGATLGVVRVAGHSMAPALSDGDFLLTNRLDYRFQAPQRGDVVIFRDPYDHTQQFVKRIVGLPGDDLLIRGGYLYVNGVLLQEPYVVNPWIVTTNWPAFSIGSDGETVPADNYFVLGDNRDHSGDSRLFGYITRRQILGRAIATILPLDHAGTLDVRPTLARGT